MAKLPPRLQAAYDEAERRRRRRLAALAPGAEMQVMSPTGDAVLAEDGAPVVAEV